MVTAPRILVIKHGALGDMVQGFDSFAGLRAGRPEARITLLTSPPFSGLMRMTPWFDEVVEDRRRPVFDVPQLLRIRTLLHQEWEMIVDLQCSRRTSRYHRFLTPSGTRWLGTSSGASDPYPDFTGVNNVERMKVAAKMAGGAGSVTAQLDWLGSAKASISKQAVVLVPGCSPAKPSKRWPAANFAAVARELMASGRDVAIVGTAADRDAADLVIAEAPGCTDMVGKTDLASLTTLFASAHAVIGNDTGPVFLAAKTGVPTLMVMGQDTDPDMSAPTGAKAGWVRQDRIENVAPQAVLDALPHLTGSEG
ncbi:MAG: glycosyltransferase family 9 protein [Pseudomonadota bacterium]|nr:glycosyltransferase family 9 protein [Pseudomonadota bacterium]